MTFTRALARVLATITVLGACAVAPSSRLAIPPVTAAERAAWQTQLQPVPVRDPGSNLASDWMTGGVMQIFVRSYQDSNGDGVGDLRGLISRLDYLQALGVRGLWLMPITPSADGDHGYAVTDYRAIDPAYGTLADFDELLRQAHARGLGVIVDFVPNHSAYTHPAFRLAAKEPASPWRDWYLWRSTDLDDWRIYGGNPWRAAPLGASTGDVYFAAFSDQMPDLNWRNPAVRQWHADTLRWWLNRGVDGFRVDAVGHLVENGPLAWSDQPENHALLRDLQEVVNSYARRTLVCEGPGASRSYAAARSCGSAFAFDLNGHLIRAAKGEPEAVRQVSKYFHDTPPGTATFLSNHDGFAGRRLADQFGDDDSAYRLAAALLLTLPGRPYLYYGEEIGMAGATTLSGDPQLRTPMSWTGTPGTAGFTTGRPYRALAANAASNHVEAQRADPGSLWHHYKALLALRNTEPALRRGGYENAFTAGPDGRVLGFQRSLPKAEGGDRLLVLVNLGAADAVVTPVALPAAARLTPIYPEAGAAVPVDPVVLPARSARVYRIVANG